MVQISQDMYNLDHETIHQDTWTYVTKAPLRFLNKSTLRLFHNYGSYLYFLVSFMSTLWISGIVMIQYLFLLEKEIQEQKGEITLKSIFSLSIYFGWLEFDSSRCDPLYNYFLRVDKT